MCGGTTAEEAEYLREEAELHREWLEHQRTLRPRVLEWLRRCEPYMPQPRPGQQEATVPRCPPADHSGIPPLLRPGMLTEADLVLQAEKSLRDLYEYPLRDATLHAAMLQRAQSSLRAARALQQRNTLRVDAPQPCPQGTRPLGPVRGLRPVHAAQLSGPSFAPRSRNVEFHEKASAIPWFRAEQLTRTARAKHSPVAELPRTSQSPAEQSCLPPPLPTVDAVVAKAEQLLRDLIECPFPDAAQHASMLERCHKSLRAARALQQQNEPRPQPSCPHITRPPCPVHGAQMSKPSSVLQTPQRPASPLQQQNEPRPQPSCPHITRPPCPVHGAQMSGPSSVLQTPQRPASPLQELGISRRGKDKGSEVPERSLMSWLIAAIRGDQLSSG
jgi:hypothetical protein